MATGTMDEQGTAERKNRKSKRTREMVLGIQQWTENVPGQQHGAAK